MSHFRLRRLLAAVLAVPLAATLVVVALPGAAEAYNPTPRTIDQLQASDVCLKGRGNCLIYAKSAQLPSGRIVVSYERAIAAASGSADGETVPIWASDDNGNTFEHVSDVAAPAYLSDDPAVAQYTSNWTNPYFYVLPEAVGDLGAGTLLLATVVSGEDYWYTEHKAANPSYVADNDGDRSDLAIALFASADDAATWEFVNIIAAGGWQGGAAGASGRYSSGNTGHQIDPVWEPYLMVYQGQLVAYYSDESEFSGYDPETGVMIIDPGNDTATDPRTQVLVHRTWDGTAASWSEPVLDVSGDTVNTDSGPVIGGGRPGMMTVVPTTDGKWLATYEYWGGGNNNRFKIADNPLRFFADGSAAGTGVSSLPRVYGSAALALGGSPVLVTMSDGRIAYNASGSGAIWVNETGRSDGAWTQYNTSMSSGYSRSLLPIQGTGRVLIVRAGPDVRFSDVDLGRSVGDYVKLVNRSTGQVLSAENLNPRDGTKIVQYTDSGSPAQRWHLSEVTEGYVRLLARKGGRALTVTGTANGTQAALRVEDDNANEDWAFEDASDGYVFLKNRNSGKYLCLGGSMPNEGWELIQWSKENTANFQWQIVVDNTDPQALSATAPVFEPVVEGYEVPEPLPLAIKSIGAEESTIRSVTLAGGADSAFVLGGTAERAVAPGTTNYTWTVQAKPDLPVGVYSDTVTVGYGVGQTVAAVLTFEVTAPAAGLAFTVATGARCAASKAVFTVTVTNDETIPVSVEIASPFGVKAFPSIAGAKSGFHAFTTRLVGIPANEVVVTVTGEVEGDQVITTQTVGYEPFSC